MLLCSQQLRCTALRPCLLHREISYSIVCWFVPTSGRTLSVVLCVHASGAGSFDCLPAIRTLSAPLTEALPLISSCSCTENLAVLRSSMGATINGQYTPLSGFQTVARTGFTDTNGAILGMLLVRLQP